MTQWVPVILLLLPVAVVLAVRPREAADLHFVQRARLAAILFPIFVVVAYATTGAVFLGEANFNSSSILPWSVMACFFAGNYIYQARFHRPNRDSGARSASLTPRHRLRIIPAAAWLVPAGAWFAAVVWATVFAETTPWVALVVLAGALFVMVLGPRLTRQMAMSPEPIVEAKTAACIEAHTRTRTTRVWFLYAVVSYSVIWKAGFAVATTLGIPATSTVLAVVAVGYLALLASLLWTERLNRLEVRNAIS